MQWDGSGDFYSFVSFGGWKTPFMKQFRIYNLYNCGTNAGVDFYQE
jgi:hypothetical protein